MNETELAAYLNVGVPTVTMILQSYSTFKKSNVEKYFELLLKEDKDLSKIGSNELLQKHVYKIIDYAANEVYEEKIEKWKNLTVKLGLGQLDYDFAENYCNVLQDLTAFDLVVLHHIYSNSDYEKFFQLDSLVKFFETKNVSSDKIRFSLKKFLNNFLVSMNDDETCDKDKVLPNNPSLPWGVVFLRNDFGKTFIEIISEV